MNIFVLDKDPTIAAQYLCDKHVPKMLLESAQMLCSPFHLMGAEAHYKLTHKNHPCNVWLRKSLQNYQWLLTHSLAISDEYTLRFGKIHKSRAVVLNCLERIKELKFEHDSLTQFALAMPVQYKTNDAVKSYRLYYINEKKEFARWLRGREQPSWMTCHDDELNQ